jgi:hypothetical protein
MNLGGFQRMMERVDVVMAELFPAVIRIAGVSYQATGVGGRAAMEFLEDGGQAPQGTRFFRIPKSFLTTPPATGTFIEWLRPGGVIDKFRVIEVPDRPQETSCVLRAEPFGR